MKFSKVREIFLTTVSEFFRVDAETLDAPQKAVTHKFPPNSLVVEPLQDLALDFSAYPHVKATCSFPLSLTYRFPPTMKFSELPLVEVETTLVCFLQATADIDPEINVRNFTNSNPVNVSTDNGWLITLRANPTFSWWLTNERVPVAIQPEPEPELPIILEEIFQQLQPESSPENF
jgi:hypothetical protein